MKIFFKTFGCTANTADTIAMQQMLSGCGHTITESADSADLVVVNTCTVTRTTEHNVLKYMRSVSGKQLVAAGCLPAARPGVLSELQCWSVTPSSIDSIMQIVGDGGMAKERYTPVSGVTGIVSISRGCAGHCSYCIVKQARGELVSRPVSQIVRDTASLIRHGAKEIQLTSQDTGAYGLDTGERLPDLLNAITALEGDYMVRVGMMNPFALHDIVDDVVDAFQNPHVFKFLHLPVQSGSDQVLEHMNRRHTAEEFRYIVHRFRHQFPDMVLSTDFIVGYPTETDRDFNDSLELLCEIKPLKVNITRYSPRPGTPAFLLHDMPDWRKKERSRILSNMHHHINHGLFRNKIGSTARVLTTEAKRHGSTSGRDIYYHKLVIQDDLPLGLWYDVEIAESKTTYLIGTLIKNKEKNQRR